MAHSGLMVRKLEYSPEERIGSNSWRMLTRTLLVSSTCARSMRSGPLGLGAERSWTTAAVERLDGRTSGGGVRCWFLGGSAGAWNGVEYVWVILSAECFN